MVPGNEKARDNVTDGAKDHSLTHDTGRAGLGTSLDAMKPSSQQTLTEKAKIQADK